MDAEHPTPQGAVDAAGDDPAPGQERAGDQCGRRENLAFHARLGVDQAHVLPGVAHHQGRRVGRERDAVDPAPHLGKRRCKPGVATGQRPEDHPVTGQPRREPPAVGAHREGLHPNVLGVPPRHGRPAGRALPVQGVDRHLVVGASHVQQWLVRMERQRTDGRVVLHPLNQPWRVGIGEGPDLDALVVEPEGQRAAVG